MDIVPKLNQANGRLRSAKVGVVIGVKGDRLHLRATFPPKPNPDKHQGSVLDLLFTPKLITRTRRNL